MRKVKNAYTKLETIQFHVSFKYIHIPYEINIKHLFHIMYLIQKDITVAPISYKLIATPISIQQTKLYVTNLAS